MKRFFSLLFFSLFTQCALLHYWIAFLCGWVMTTPIIAQEMNYPPVVRSALAKAGANKNSLEGLLVRYRNEGNTEKFRAACFLIANMPYYEQQGRVINGTERLDSITQSIDHLYFNLVRGQTAEAQETDPLHALIKQSAKESAEHIKSIEIEEPNVEISSFSDLITLDSAFLARHIENAFSLREDIPFLKQLPLSDFFEYVLPYRAFGDYPLVTNGAELTNLFRKYILPEREDSVNALGASYNRVLWWLRHHGGQYPFETMIGFKELFFNGFHDCVDVTNYATQIYRSIGVPAISEFNMAYKIWDGRHYTTSILWRDGKWYSHSPESELPTGGRGFAGCLNLYREHFSLQPNTPFALHAEGEQIPDVFQLPGLEDISRQHLKIGTLSLQVPDGVAQGRNLVYLATFQRSAGLIPVTWGVIDHDRQHAIFENVVDGNIYYPVYTDSIGRLQSFDMPFSYFEGKKKAIGEYLQPYKENCSTLSAVRLFRKYPRKPHLLKIAEEMVGTVVLGSDDPSFKQADTLAVINYVPDTRWERLPLREHRPYKYYRVRAPKSNPHMRLAEIQFLTARSHGYKNVTDTLEFGTTDSLLVRLLDAPLAKCSWKKEYDLNVQTAPEAYPDVTLRLQEAQMVDEVRFVVKHADNSVKPGHIYVLYAWTDDGWHFMERMEAQEDYVEPQTPMEINRLYWLSDLTEGREELPFIIDKEGRQLQPYTRVLEYVDQERER